MLWFRRKDSIRPKYSEFERVSKLIDDRPEWLSYKNKEINGRLAVFDERHQRTDVLRIERMHHPHRNIKIAYPCPLHLRDEHCTKTSRFAPLPPSMQGST